MSKQASATPEEKLTVVEAAAYLSLAKGTLDNWRNKGIGPKFIRLGHGKRGPVRYRKAVLDEWLKSRERSHT